MTSTATSVGEFFQLFRDGVAKTRSELAQLSALSRPTVSARIDELFELDLIRSADQDAPTGGRPSSRLEFNRDAAVVLAIDVGASHVRVGVCDLAGNVLIDHESNTSVAVGPRLVLDEVLKCGQTQIDELGLSAASVVAVGLGLPGPVEHATGRPTSPPIMPGWDGFDVPMYVRQRFDVPVLVDNDVNIMALGERTRFWPDIEDMVFVKAGTGIGSGVIADGRLRRGASGAAGDVGHIFVTYAIDERCRCGKRGCVEAYAGMPAIAESLRREGVVVDNPKHVIELVRSGNMVAVRRVRDAGRAIGAMLNAGISVLNPSIIVVGGQLAQAGEALLAGIREEVYANSAPLATRNLLIVEARLGERAGVVGAGILGIEHVLAPSFIDGRVASRT